MHTVGFKRAESATMNTRYHADTRQWESRYKSVMYLVCVLQNVQIATCANVPVRNKYNKQTMMVRENECFGPVNYGIKTCPCCNLYVRGNCEGNTCRNRKKYKLLQLVRARELRGLRNRRLSVRIGVATCTCVGIAR